MARDARQRSSSCLAVRGQRSLVTALGDQHSASPHASAAEPEQGVQRVCAVVARAHQRSDTGAVDPAALSQAAQHLRGEPGGGLLHQCRPVTGFHQRPLGVADLGPGEHLGQVDTLGALWGHDQSLSATTIAVARSPS